MFVLTADKKKVFDVQKGEVIANTGKEYKGKINIFYTGKIKTEINGEKVKSVMLASCNDERGAERYLEWFCDELNARHYPTGRRSEKF